MSKHRLHASHPEVIRRLRRAQGHLGTVVAMIGEGRACLDIAQQLQAVEKAVANAKKMLIHDHIDHCLEDALRGPATGRGKSVTEFRQITKYL